MNFKELLEDARTNRESAEKLIEMYRPMLLKASIVDREYDEDLYQELMIVLLRCIRIFPI
jgi:DNA-directed RNA polymerase specialized sigma24 family protein